MDFFKPAVAHTAWTFRQNHSTRPTAAEKLFGNRQGARMEVVLPFGGCLPALREAQPDRETNNNGDTHTPQEIKTEARSRLSGKHGGVRTNFSEGSFGH